MKFTRIMGIPFTKFRFFFHRVSITINTTSARDAECWSCKTFAEVSELFTHAVFQLVITHKTASSECTLQGAKTMEVLQRRFSRCLVFDGEHFQHPSCGNFPLAKFSDDSHNCWFSNPYCDTQFTCHDVVVILNQHISLVFGLCRPCHGWSAAVGPVSNVLFTNLKTMNPAPELTPTASTLYNRIQYKKGSHCSDPCTSTITDPWCRPYGHDILINNTSQMSMNLYRTGTFCNKKFSHHSRSSTHVYYIHCFALLC
jgi:hypothetical protein